MVGIVYILAYKKIGLTHLEHFHKLIRKLQIRNDEDESKSRYRNGDGFLSSFVPI